MQSFRAKVGEFELKRSTWKAAYAFARLMVALKAGFKPEQPRDELGRWTIEDGVEARTSPSFYTGIPSIDETSDALSNILKDIIRGLDFLPAMSPAAYGTFVHGLFAAAVRLKGLPGVGDTERTFDLSTKEVFAMSMEIYLLTLQAVPTTQAWQKGIDLLGFNMQFLDEQLLQAKEIRLRAQCRGKPVLLELERTNLTKVRERFPAVSFPEDVTNVHALYWNKTLEAGLAAYEAAAAYLDMARGLMIDSEEAKLRTQTGAIEIARDMFAQMPMLEDAMASILARMTARSRN